MNGATEFLAKSLVGAGLFLAIPATGIMVLAVIFGGIYLPFLQVSAAACTCALFAFCLVGFFLLFHTIRFVCAASKMQGPVWLWAATTIYLFIIIGVALLGSFGVMRRRAQASGAIGAATRWRQTFSLSPQLLFCFPFGRRSFHPPFGCVMHSTATANHAQL